MIYLTPITRIMPRVVRMLRCFRVGHTVFVRGGG